MEIFGALIGLMFFIMPFIIIGGVIYLIVRRRNGNGGISAYDALIAYFYFVTAASVFTIVIGLGYLLFALISQFYGNEKVSNEVTVGLTLLITGLIICCLHVFGRRAFEIREKKTSRTLRRVFLFFMLSVFGISGLVSLPAAVYAAAHYYVNISDNHRDSPAGELAAALIIIPLWVYYLLRVLKETQASEDNEK